MSVELLDCTLRDGAYLLDKNFSSSEMISIYRGLNNANIDYIEVGFLQNRDLYKNNVFFNSRDCQMKLQLNTAVHNICVLADLDKYDFDNLDENSGNSFDIIRLCFKKKDKDCLKNASQQIKKKKYKLFVQPVDIKGYSKKELMDLLYEINEIRPDVFSIVDTFGDMDIDDLESIYNDISNSLFEGCKIGFHSHNNMQMSNALAQFLVKISNRSLIIDCSLYGMGRGAGNINTEIISLYLNKRIHGNYNIDVILDLIEKEILKHSKNDLWGYSIPILLSGIESAHVNSTEYLKSKTDSFFIIKEVLHSLDEQTKKLYRYEIIERAYNNYKFNN